MIVFQNRLFVFARYNVNSFRFINSHCDGYYLDENSKKTYNEFLDFIITVIDDGKEKGILRPLPSAALIAIVYEPIVMIIRMLEIGKITYTPDLVKELEGSS
ncbi:hypothetical protein [Peribacillus loiseleuriae]|uniref:hypothetical protein n=1 Tax=Peribacillus loiseleuriae TaxID=1679170 RepID=UPI003D00CFAA